MQQKMYIEALIFDMREREREREREKERERGASNKLKTQVLIFFIRFVTFGALLSS